MSNVAKRFGSLAMAVAIASAGSLASGQAPALGAARAIVVTPASGLSDGQSVAVTGSGFSPNASMAATQCLAGAVAQASCDLSGVSVFASDAAGAFHASLTVHASITTPTGTADCTVVGQCIVGAAEITNINTANAFAPIVFQPAAPPQRGNVAVSPSTYSQGDSVTVTGSQWAAGAQLTASVCSAGVHDYDAAQCNGVYKMSVDANGDFVPLQVLGDSFAGSSDCHLVGACVMLVVDPRDPPNTWIEIPITLVEPSLGTAQATPATNLHHQQTITVSGTGWAPHRDVYVIQCFGPCDAYASTIFDAITDASGSFSVSVDVNRFYVDSPVCGVGTTVCTLSVEDYNSDGTALTASVALSFAPIAPAQRGSLVSPSIVPFPQQYVGADLAGWANEAPIQVGVCAAGHYDSTCIVNTLDVGTSGGYDGYSVYAPPSLNGADCTAPGNCEVVAWDPRNIAGTVVANAYQSIIAQAGTLVVTPSANLSDGQTVSVTGTGWPAKYSLTLAQCPSGSQYCGYGQNNSISFYTDGAGGFSQQFTVHESVPDGQGWSTDCTQSAGACSMFGIFNGSGRVVHGETSISFTPTSYSATSHYSATELAQIQAGAAKLGLTTAEFQRISTWATLWMLGVAHSSAVPPGVDAGPSAVMTTYPNFEYQHLSSVASSHGITVAELQKGSALLVAFLLAM